MVNKKDKRLQTIGAAVLDFFYSDIPVSTCKFEIYLKTFAKDKYSLYGLPTEDISEGDWQWMIKEYFEDVSSVLETMTSNGILTYDEIDGFYNLK